MRVEFEEEGCERSEEGECEGEDMRGSSEEGGCEGREEGGCERSEEGECEGSEGEGVCG